MIYSCASAKAGSGGDVGPKRPVKMLEPDRLPESRASDGHSPQKGKEFYFGPVDAILDLVGKYSMGPHEVRRIVFNLLTEGKVKAEKEGIPKAEMDAAFGKRIGRPEENAPTQLQETPKRAGRPRADRNAHAEEHAEVRIKKNADAFCEWFNEWTAKPAEERDFEKDFLEFIAKNYIRKSAGESFASLKFRGGVQELARKSKDAASLLADFAEKWRQSLNKYGRSKWAGMSDALGEEAKADMEKAQNAGVKYDHIELIVKTLRHLI